MLYAGGSNLFRSDDGGGRWTLVRRAGAGVGGFRAAAVRVSPHDGSVWVASGNGVEVSPDGGLNWQVRNQGLPGTIVGVIESPRIMVIDPAVPGTVYAALSLGLFATSDNGASWQNLTEKVSTFPGGPPDPQFITAIALDPFDRRIIYAGTFNRGLLRTTDGGRTWSRVLEFTPITTLAVDPVSPNIVYAGVRDFQNPQRTVLQSRDRGDTWTVANEGLMMRVAPSRLAVHPRDPVRLYATNDFFTDLTYIARLQGGVGGTSSLGLTFASYLADGVVRDLTVAPTGETTLAVMRTLSSAAREEIAVVRIGGPQLVRRGR